MAGMNYANPNERYLDDNDNVSEMGLGDPGNFSIPSLSDFSATKSDASIMTKAEGEDEKLSKEAKHGGTLAAIRQGIKTMPDSGYIHTYLFQGDWYKSLRSIFLVSDRPTIHRLAYRSPVAVFIERSRHLASFPNVIHPYSAFRWYWDILMTLFLMVTLITDPLRMTFFGESLMEGSSFHVQVGLVITAMYLTDILLNFRTGLIDQSTQLVNLDTEIIARKYACGWFMVDVLSTIPFDLIFIVYTKGRGGYFDGETTYVQVVRILELFKIFRLSRAVRYVSRLLLVRILSPAAPCPSPLFLLAVVPTLFVFISGLQSPRNVRPVHRSLDHRLLPHPLARLSPLAHPGYAERGGYQKTRQLDLTPWTLEQEFSREILELLLPVNESPGGNDLGLLPYRTGGNPRLPAQYSVRDGAPRLLHWPRLFNSPLRRSPRAEVCGNHPPGPGISPVQASAQGTPESDHALLRDSLPTEFLQRGANPQFRFRCSPQGSPDAQLPEFSRASPDFPRARIPGDLCNC